MDSHLCVVLYPEALAMGLWLKADFSLCLRRGEGYNINCGLVFPL